ncbi:MAG: hypothetical protein V3U98_11550, partial [Acidobacteriota bacterium]
EGRLLGALAYRFGTFPKEPLAGITPIEKMLPVLELPQTEPARLAHVDPRRWSLPVLPAVAGAVVDFGDEESEGASAREYAGTAPRNPDLWELAAGLQPSASGIAAGDPGAGFRWRGGGGELLRPIETPLVFSSIDPSVLSLYRDRLRRLGLFPVQGGAAASAAGAPKATRFEAGSPIAAQLVRGDIDVSASGTVTYLSEGKLLAFGHPFLRSGSIDMPFAAARVLVTVPSLDNSFKMTVSGESLGVLRQDRLTAIAGQVGEPAEMIAVRLAIDSAGSAPRNVSFEVFRDPIWAPLVLEIAMASSLVNALDFSLPATVSLEGVLRFEGHPDFHLANVFSGPGTPLTVQQTAARYLTSIFAVLYANRFETPRLRGIEVQIEQRPERRFVVVEDLWLSRTRVAPGETVTARAFLRPYHGERYHRDFEIRIPPGLPPGRVSVLIGGGQAIQAHTQRLLRVRLMQSETLDQMMEVLSDLPRYDRLYARLVRRSRGGILKQREVPGLPPSVSRVLRSSEVRGDFTPHREEILLEQHADLDGTVYGGRRMVLRVESR